MLDFFIPLLGSYLTSGILDFWFWYLICLALLATVPVIIRSFFKWR